VSWGELSEIGRHSAAIHSTRIRTSAGGAAAGTRGHAWTCAGARAVREALAAELAGVGPAAGGVAPAVCAGAGPAAGGVAGVGQTVTGGMAALRGPMTTFDNLLADYVAYNNLADASAQLAFLREHVGVKKNSPLVRLILTDQVISCLLACYIGAR